MTALASGLLADLGATAALVAAPMAGGPSRPELVIAASRAGAHGFLAGGYKTAAELAEQISAVQEETPRLGVNLFVPNPVPLDAQDRVRYEAALRRWTTEQAAARSADRRNRDPAWPAAVTLPTGLPEHADDAWAEKLALLEAQPVPVISLTFGLPSRADVRRLQATGAKVLLTVTSAAEAAQAEAAGVDGLIVQSSSAGGHSGTWTPVRKPRQIELDELLPAVRAQTGLPLWAAGGLATPEAVSAVLTAGAEAVAVGTVLLRCVESGAHPVHKQALADAREAGQTVVTTAFSGRPARALRNCFAAELTEQAPLGFPALHHMTSSLRRASAAAGDPEGLNLWAGTGFARASDEPAEVILRRLAGF
ncbi:NAD(P)H-dependent flavin oxidoreductase [Nesterenkonia lutea]|uniref:Propionate 3-nitronate monooxygenase n=1 Tax=Nesterenkonia lutea TaxID=272919 RepID=A0ABR9JCZ9_9MICC|nr:nitronate monooxygenase [Nesterenkonia lutea]MBE1523806.1 NAD(P)H-dependent flavin oxidoreductase YrpB (nitropropane dioxygenase family) [Nesterenkonia lutea]